MASYAPILSPWDSVFLESPATMWDAESADVGSMVFDWGYVWYEREDLVAGSDAS